IADEATYVIDALTCVEECSLSRAGELILVARDLLEQVAKDAKISAYDIVATHKGSDFAGTVTAHPLRGADPDGYYDFDVRLFPADFVTMDAGTGFVHIAPGHGADDFVLGMQHGVEVPATVDEEGVYYK